MSRRFDASWLWLAFAAGVATGAALAMVLIR
jgi:hypothetical protein